MIDKFRFLAELHGRIEVRPAEQAPAASGKGWTIFGTEAESQEQQEQDGRGRLWFRALTRANSEKEIRRKIMSELANLDELDGISFCEIGLNWEEQAELIEQAEARILWDLWWSDLMGSWFFLWLFGIGPFFGDVREFAVFWA